MAHLNHLGGLKREIHHVKTLVDGSEKYEPAMVITRPERPGSSFIIPIGAFHKYIDPSDNRDEITVLRDRQDFGKIVAKAAYRRQFAVGVAETFRATTDTACCAVAEMFARTIGILLCTSWNLAKMMQVFEIQPSPPAAAQLLLWVQDGLDDLKNFPGHDQDDRIPGSRMAEMVLKNGNKTIFDGEVPMTEADLYVPDEVTKH
jgi:hypothetical protein